MPLFTKLSILFTSKKWQIGALENYIHFEITFYGNSRISLKENFDTSTPTGKLMLTLIGAINEFERACIRERQREGIKLAVDKGVYKGRKPKELKNFDEIYELWVNKRISATNAAQTLGIARQTFYSRIKQKENQG